MVTAPDIPGHRVGGVLGAGGFATVYRCWQVAVGREVAVKVDNRALHSERDRRRFFREVTSAGRLSGHPHVIDVYDAGTLADGRPYLVMELCPVGSLDDALSRHADLPLCRRRIREPAERLAVHPLRTGRPDPDFRGHDQRWKLVPTAFGMKAAGNRADIGI